MKLRLIIEIDAVPRNANVLASVIGDYADEQFAVMTIENGRPAALQSWIVRPKKDGTFA